MEWIVLEGNRQKMDGGSMFGHAPKVLWEKWVNVDDKNRALISCRSILFKVDGKNILFEAGVGAFFSPKMKERYGVEEKEHLLLKELHQRQIDPLDIDHIILSHLHFDHVGGLLSAYDATKPLELVFKNAQFWVSKKGLERAKSPHIRDKASFIDELVPLLEESGRLRLIEGKGTFPFSPDFSYRESHGHTPGLLVVRVKTPQGLLYLSSDLIPGIPWVHLPITTSFDRFPELAIDEKKALLEEIIQENGTLFLTHDLKHPFCKVAKDADRFKVVII